MKIWPSVMPKDQGDLNLQLKKLQGVAKFIHLDVSDGKFVPTKNAWFNLRLSKKFKYSVHLMIQNPKAWIQKFGTRIEFPISQWEVIKDKGAFIAWLKKNKYKVAFALKPETRVSELKEWIGDIDYMLLLTVHPGYYGAKFLRSPLKKIGQIKKLNSKVQVIVDGGMTPKTIGLAKKAGADLYVSGSFISKSDNPKKAIKELNSSLVN